METEEGLILGGNIQLGGFQGFRGDEMVIVKKMVGHYARLFSDRCDRFQGLNVQLNSLPGENGPLFEVRGELKKEEDVVSTEATDKNFFFVLDKVLKDIENSL